MESERQKINGDKDYQHYLKIMSFMETVYFSVSAKMHLYQVASYCYVAFTFLIRSYVFNFFSVYEDRLLCKLCMFINQESAG